MIISRRIEQHRIANLPVLPEGKSKQYVFDKDWEFLCPGDSSSVAPILIKIYGKWNASKTEKIDLRIDEQSAYLLYRGGFRKEAVECKIGAVIGEISDSDVYSEPVMKKLCASFLRTRHIPYTTKNAEGFNLLKILLPFFSLKGIDGKYIEHLKAEKDGLKTKPDLYDAEAKELAKILYSDDLSTETPYTLEDVLFIAIMITISSVKPFATVQEAAFVVKKSLAQFVKYSSRMGLKPNNFTNAKFIDTKCLFGLDQYLNKFPETKKMLLDFMLTVDDGSFGETIKLLLSPCYMTINHCIYLFILSKTTTKEQAEPSINREIKLWLSSYKQLLKELGDKWIYYPLFVNKDRMDPTKWPKLAAISYYHCMVYLELKPMMKNVMLKPKIGFKYFSEFMERYSEATGEHVQTDGIPGLEKLDQLDANIEKIAVALNNDAAVFEINKQFNAIVSAFKPSDFV